MGNLKIFSVGSTLCYFILPSIVLGDEYCNALLNHGIAEHYKEERVDNSSSKITKEICDTYQSYKSNSLGADASARYNLFSGSASLSKSEIESIGKLMCENNLSDTASNNAVLIASDKISGEALGAWKSCNEQSNNGLKAKTDFSADGGAVTISLSYILPAFVKTYPMYSGYSVAPKGTFICTGSLEKMKLNSKLTADEVGMLCERQSSKDVVLPNGQIQQLPAATISIFTTAGTVTRHVSAILKSPPPLPIKLGEISASMLSETVFIKVNGSGWILSDGRKVPGTAYAKMIGEAVPDLRGVYLRGKNYDRDKAKGNAEGDLSLGTFQAFELVKHSHVYNEMFLNNDVDGVDSVTTHSFEHHTELALTQPYGGAEVRPNSVTVNYFIKVD